jgi:hypothetical protein
MEYHLEKKLEGEAARLFVDKLHFQKVAPLKTEIGFYKSSGGPAAIYISFYANGEQAETALKKMTQKISTNNSVFIGGEFSKIKDKTVYRCFGMGQSHAIFSDRNFLFWISTNTVGGKKFLINYINYLENN